MEEHFVWMTTRQIKPGMLADFERAWRPGRAPGGHAACLRPIGRLLKVIGGLPLGTPAAFEAVFGTSGLVELLEDYGFAPHAYAPGRVITASSAQAGQLSEGQVGPYVPAWRGGNTIGPWTLGT